MKRYLLLLLLTSNCNLFSAQVETLRKRKLSALQENNALEENKRPNKKRRIEKPLYNKLQKIVLGSKIDKNYHNLNLFKKNLNKFTYNSKKFERFQTPPVKYNYRISNWFTNTEKTAYSTMSNYKLKPLIDGLSYIFFNDGKKVKQTLILSHDFPYAFDGFLDEKKSTIQYYSDDTTSTDFTIPGEIIDYNNNFHLYGFYTWSRNETETHELYKHFFHRSMKVKKILTQEQYSDPQLVKSHHDQKESLPRLNTAQKNFYEKQSLGAINVSKIIFCLEDSSIAFETEHAIYGIKMKYTETMFIIYKE